MIKAEEIYKEYENVVAVNNLSLEVTKNSVFALIGPNGAGKTTFLKIVATLIEQTKGKVYIDGIDNLENTDEVRKKIGLLPDFFYLYEDLKVREYLEYFCQCYLIPKEKHKERIDEVIEIVNLEIKKEEFISNLSRGMKQRVGIAKTLLHEPDLLIFDEPASGLDPKARIDLRNLIKSLKKMGKTIIVSSHILTELSDFCDSFGLMEKGVMVKSGNIEDIALENQLKEIKIEVFNNIDNAFTLLKALENTSEIYIKDNLINLVFKGSLEELSEINSFLVKNDIKVISFYEKKKNIEDIFMQYSHNEVN